MKLELVRDKAKIFPAIENPLDITEIRIWNCRYGSLSPIRQCKNAEKVTIATFPDPSLELIGDLHKLKFLEINHLPEVRELSPLSKLKHLQTLDLIVLPSWNKPHHITSLEPLQGLSKLKHIGLRGMIVDDGSLQPLHSCSSLVEFASGNFFTMQELLRLKAARPGITGGFLEPVVEIPHSPCAKCGSPRVILSGVPRYAVKCPKCNRNRVQKHLEEWRACESRING